AAVWPQTNVDASTLANHTSCARFTFVSALGPLIAFAFYRRRSDPVAPRLTGLAIGAASGAWGALTIELHCGHTSLTHVMIGHLVPVAVLMLVGVLVGHFVVAVRAQRA